MGNIYSTLCGTPLWMSPERLNGDQYTENAELWSIGIIFYEFVFNAVPWEARKGHELFGAIVRNPTIQFPLVPQISDELKHLLTQMLQVDPKNRLTWAEFFSHPALDLKIQPPTGTVSAESSANKERLVKTTPTTASITASAISSITLPSDSTMNTTLPAPVIKEKLIPLTDSWLAIEKEFGQFETVLNTSKIQPANFTVSSQDMDLSVTKVERHEFYRSHSKLPSLCIYCSNPTLGLFVQRVYCIKCCYSAHLSCANTHYNTSECLVAAYKVQGHLLRWSSFTSPTWCGGCRGFIWGISAQSLCCDYCQVAVHEACLGTLHPCAH